MRIKVITKDQGEFLSDEFTAVSYPEAIDWVDKATRGNFNNLRFDYNGGKIFFTGEVLKTSVFIVFKD
jgi:hypothetical protein